MSRSGLRARLALGALTLVALFAVSASAADSWITIAPDGSAVIKEAAAAGAPATTVLRADAEGLAAQLATSGFTIETVGTKGGDFVRIEWPEAPIAGEVGTPGLPVVRELFIAPPGVDVVITYEAGEPATVNLEGLKLPLAVLPVQPPIEKIPGARENAPFIHDGFAYGFDSEVFTQRAGVTELGVVREQRLFLLEIRPVDYNPVAGTLSLYSDITVQVEFVGDPAPRSAIAPFAGVNSLTLNPDPMGRASRLSGNYLIVVPTTFETNIAGFAATKTSQGYDVNMHVVAPGTSNTVIKSYIQSLWGNPATAPLYVLIVGDTNLIPHWIGTGTGSPATDIQYGCMDGASDYYPDIAYGRLPARTPEQLAAMLDKILYYEVGPLADPDYLKRASFMASVDNYTISEGTHNYVIDNYMGPDSGFIAQKLYQVTHGADTQDVTDAFNDGRFWGIYSGHGGTYSWADGPPFSQDNVRALVNQNLYACVWSFACITGTYTVDECFVETWLREPNKGALAMWGSSVNSYWTEDDILEKRLFDCIFDEEDDVLSELGPVWNDTMIRYLAHFGDNGTTRRYFEMYNLMGDPSMRFPGSCGDAGTVAIDSTAYACSDVASISVVDCGLNTSDSMIEMVTVAIDSTSETGVELVVLTETDAASAEFAGTIPLSTTDAAGTLLVAEGDTVTVTYVDADDGGGNVDVIVTASAVVDCTSPNIGNVQTIDIQPRSATVTFDADEPARGIIHYGESCGALTGMASGSAYATSVAVSLSGLQDATTYFYSVEAEDVAGNSVADDNGGACYTFTTPDIPNYFTELFDADNDLANWSLTFIPNGTVDYYVGCAESITELPTDPTGGTNLNLSDDSFGTCNLSGLANVRLYSGVYSTFYPCSNGYITFDHGETGYTETLDAHFALARVSALFDDLNPASGGNVIWQQFEDRAVVTWDGVVEYGTSSPQTFQVELFFNGDIRISYLTISVSDGLAGLSAGGGMDPEYWETDLSAMGPCEPPDCNDNGIPDPDEIAACPGDPACSDCNGNGVPDECDLSGGASADCNGNSIPDECDIAAGTSQDCNGNAVPDACDLVASTSLDCNANTVPDECDISSGTSEDCNSNTQPDECDLVQGLSEDCNGNTTPDECEITAGTVEDCNHNDIPDECDLGTGASPDDNTNGIPDECELVPPAIAAEGSRYFAVTPQPWELPVAMHVSGDPAYAEVACVSFYVQADGSLGDTPVYLTPAEWGTVHVCGEAIVPELGYAVKTQHPDGYVSSIQTATLWAWGDADNNGLVNFVDINLVVQGFQGEFGNVSLEAVDLEPCTPNGVIDFNDINKDVRAFQGLPYSAEGCPDPCGP